MDEFLTGAISSGEDEPESNDKESMKLVLCYIQREITTGTQSLFTYSTLLR